MITTASKKRLLSAFVLIWTLVLLAPGAKPKQPLAEQSYKQIWQNYHFVGDFRTKEETRPLGDEVFWRYPISLPRIEFPIINEGAGDTAALEAALPATTGAGLALHHLNRGRKLMLEGDLEGAKATWLSARARYGDTFPFHRRNDYFLGSVFLRLAQQSFATSHDWQEAKTKGLMENASTFLSWAFQIKREVNDEFIDSVAARGFYNLATIYYRYDRYPPAYGAARDGLDYLRRTGKTEYRAALRRLLAETYIKNRSYLEAVQELDTALRQDPSREEAAAIFARVGDIYFDLNNFELAEDAYALSLRIDDEVGFLDVNHFTLRGESLFWLGKFSEAQKMFYFALNSSQKANAMTAQSPDLLAIASMRIADSWLARKDYPQARLAYFKHEMEYRGHPTAKYAAIRLACLELPEYDGNNIMHARSELAVLKNDGANQIAQELAAACEVASYAQHDRNPDMLERVKAFAQLYPESRFLKGLAPAVREFQATKIEPFFAAGDLYGATAFFETHQQRLFPQPSIELQRQLFVAYADTHRSAKAEPFWAAYQSGANSRSELLRQAVVASELATGKKRWQNESQKLAARLRALPPAAKPENELSLAIHRILATSVANHHRAWIYEWTKNWPKIDVSYFCELSYPLLSEMYHDPKSPLTQAQVATETSTQLSLFLNEALKLSSFCAYSMLELEWEIYRDEPEVLASRYASRDYLPIDDSIAKLLWAVAESLKAKGDRAGAEKLWQLLVSKGETTIPEVRYAKVRLSKQRTELEDLWQR